MNELVKPCQANMQKTIDHLTAELAAVRAGRANPDVLNKITVDYYGTPTPINQVAAVNAALNSFTKVILADHIHTCVTEDVQAGSSEKVDELVKTLQKLMK